MQRLPDRGESLDGACMSVRILLRLAAPLLLMFAGGHASAGLLALAPGGEACLPACAAGHTCSQGRCIVLAACGSDDDCSSDTRCEAGVGCVGWSGASTTFYQACGLPAPRAVMDPQVKCSFAQAPPGDPFPAHLEVQNTPIAFPADSPDIAGARTTLLAAVFTTPLADSYTEDAGVIRVLRASDCSLVANLGGSDLDGDGLADFMVSSFNLAAADLDADGTAELVAAGADGSTFAFTSDAGQWRPAPLWRAPYPAAQSPAWQPCMAANHRCLRGWGAFSVHDLDDDAQPEIVREGVVFSAAGALRSGPPPGYAAFASGIAPVLANLDDDAAIEFSNGQAIWEWLAAGWSAEAGFAPAAPDAGHVAYGDFGSYGTGLPAPRPELVVVRFGSYSLYAATGELIDSHTIPGFLGGPPVVADFDGDGLLEAGFGNTLHFTVVDLDCGASPRPGGQCAAGTCTFAGGACPSGIAWSRPIQEATSGSTPVAAIDLEGDGASEIVASDECFTRAFDARGTVLFSRYNSSCTWSETPLLADLDGDRSADLVIASNTGCGPLGQGRACPDLTASGVDPLFNGAACSSDAQCASGDCDAGLCRCTSAAQCCAAGNAPACEAEGFRCVAPEAGTPGSGNTCRMGRPGGKAGLTVFEDRNWSNTRPLWNQSAYAITHVRDDATIPRRADWARNWQADSDSFRAQPGWGLPAPDLTAGPASGFACAAGKATLTGRLCNRGSGTLAAGVDVAFLDGAQTRCSAATVAPLAPGACVSVSCDWTGAPTSHDTAVDLTVRADAGSESLECHEGNNLGRIEDVACLPPRIFANGFEGG
jgi:hypothetical protein